MKNWIYILMIGLMGSLVSSCQQSLDEEVQLPVTTGKAHISFTIALDDIRSRAAWEDNEGATDAVVGLENENQIDLSTEDGLQVFVYDLNGDLLGEVTDKEVRKVNANTYSFNGQLDIENLQGSTLPCRLEVYANCIESNVTFDYDVEYIPMWGTKETTLQLAKGELTKLPEPIYLLRAMAKVEVRLADDIAEDFELTSVSVDKYNITGNVLPSYGELVDTEMMDDQSVFNPNATSSGTDLWFNKVEDEESFFVYLPEYDNSKTPATLSVTINEKPYTIEFKNYVNGSATGEAYNLVRNHYYQYTITSVKTGLDLTLSVVPWTVKVDVLSYTETVGYSVDESDLGWTDIDSQNDVDIFLNTGNNVDAASFKMKLMTPYGAKWMAVLEDAQDKFTFDTGEGFSGELVEGSTKTIEGNIGNDTEGTIVTLGIKAKDSSETGEYSAKLRLYVQLETGKWFEIDLTDGEVDNGVENYIINHLKSSV